MYLIFNAHGHYEVAVADQPQSLAVGYFMVEGERLEQAYAYSDGKNIYQTDTPPPSQYHALINGDWVLPDSLAAVLLEAAKVEKIKQIGAEAQACINAAAAVDLVPEFERASWPKQAEEAHAWSIDKSAATPMLDGIAASRGVPADALKAAALRKTIVYEKLVAHFGGQRQAWQAKIEAAKTQAELDKIVIQFTPPAA